MLRNEKILRTSWDILKNNQACEINVLGSKGKLDGGVKIEHLI